MAIEVDNMTPDTEIGGAEVIPVSDAGSPKSITPAKIKDYTIDQIEALTAGSTISGVSVYVLHGGVLKPVPFSVLSQGVLTSMWGKTAETSPDNADVMTLKDGSTEKTVTLAVLAEFVRSVIEAAILDVSNLTEASSITDSDNLLVTQGSTGKKTTVSDLVAKVYAALASHVTSLTAVSSAADADTLYVIQGGTAKKITLAQIGSHIGGGVSGPVSPTENTIAQWDNAGGLKANLALQESVSTTSTHSTVPTAKAAWDLFRNLNDRPVEVQAESGSACDLNLDLARVHDVTMTAACTFTFLNAPSGGRTGHFVLLLSQDDTGSHNPTWPVSVVWPGGAPPIGTDAANATDVLEFFTVDGGTTWFGKLIGGDFS